VPLSRFTSRVGGGSAFFVRRHWHFMKKFIIIGLSVVLLIGAFLVWHHPHPSLLTGTWIADFGNGKRNTTTVQSDGSYVALVTGSPDGQVRTWKGRMDAKDGQLINTISNEMVGTQTVAVRKNGIVVRAKIIQMDDHTLVIQPPDLTNSGASQK